MSWKDIIKRDFPSEKYALLVKVIDDRFGDGVEFLEGAKDTYDRMGSKPMTDDDFVRAWIKNQLYMMDRQKEFSIDDEKFALYPHLLLF